MYGIAVMSIDTISEKDAPAGQGRIEKPPLPRRAFGVDEAAAMLGINRATIYRMMNDGELATFLIGGRRLIPAEEIDALLAGASDAPPRLSSPARSAEASRKRGRGRPPRVPALAIP